MAGSTGQPVAIGLRLYRALASAFPYEFKNAYGDDLVQVAEDSIEPIWREHGMLGLVRLLVDIAIRVPAEHLAELRQDIRYGLRMLAASPGFTAVAILSLSLGICVATCAFSEINTVILRNSPGVEQPDRLVAVQPASSYPNYLRYRERTDLFSSTLAYLAPVPFGVAVGGRTERIWGHLVTPSYFPALGVRPALGRAFEEQASGGPSGQVPTVMVSYRFWLNHLGADPATIGKTIRINGHQCTIIGVGPKDFLGASPLVFYADLWMPLSVGPRVAPELAGNVLEQRDLAMFQVVGRLQPGISLPQAEAGLDTVARQLEQAYGEEDKSRKGRRLGLLPGGKAFPIRSQDVPLVTGFPMTLVSLILLIACSNVANMMLARATRRRREIAVRLALGASRARLIRQLVTESMLVAAGAGVLGFSLCSWLMHMASQVKMPLPMPVSYDLTPDVRVFLFSMVLSVFTGLAFGLAPAFAATRTDLTPALKEGGAMGYRGYRRFGLRNTLMLVQMAGSLMVLLLTGFLVLGFQRTTGIKVGFNPNSLYLLSLDPMRDGYTGPQAADFLDKLLERVERLPSIRAACLTDTVPMASNGNPSVTFSTTSSQQHEVNHSHEIHHARKYVVGRDYFDTLGIPILLGRGFRPEDLADDSPAVIVTQRLVHDFWPGEDGLGRLIRIGDDQMRPIGLDSLGTFDHRSGVAGRGRQAFEIVGVIKDVKNVFSMEDERPGIYFPLRKADYAQPSMRGVTLMVRASPGGDAVAAVRREISAMDPNLTAFNVHSMPEQIDQFMFLVRLAMEIYGTIGLFGLILAAIGLAGVTAYSVTQRGREIGIRVALGAGRRDVLRLVMSEGVGLVAAGTLLGMAGAWGAARLLSAILTSLATATSASMSDPVLLVGAPLLLAGLALAACYVPARRSTRIDPVVALRQG